MALNLFGPTSADNGSEQGHTQRNAHNDQDRIEGAHENKVAQIPMPFV
jgi:hypothetical protein